MKKEHTILGIDLGGCMSGNSAYVYAKVTDDDIKIIEHFKEPRSKSPNECAAFLQAALTRHDVDAIAIDAPLSLPRKLLDSGAVTKKREGSGEIINPYLFRDTDHFIYQRFGLRPMPPAGDRIGRLTARAIEMLHNNHYDFPNITLQDRKIPIYEVYPKQIAQALGLTHYKKDPKQLFELIGCESDESFDEHLLDALLCSYAGHKILQGETLYPPEEAAKEGWCFPLIG